MVAGFVAAKSSARGEEFAAQSAVAGSGRRCGRGKFCLLFCIDGGGGGKGVAAASSECDEAARVVVIVEISEVGMERRRGIEGFERHNFVWGRSKERE